MAEKIVNSIKEAEKSAKSIIEDRKKQNLSELEDAKAKAKERLISINSAKQKSILSAQNRAADDAKQEIAKLREEYDAKISAMSDVASKNIDESVKFIIANI